jgi:hypothetical protein
VLSTCSSAGPLQTLKVPATSAEQSLKLQMIVGKSPPRLGSKAAMIVAWNREIVMKLKRCQALTISLAVQCDTVHLTTFSAAAVKTQRERREMKVGREQNHDSDDVRSASGRCRVTYLSPFHHLSSSCYLRCPVNDSGPMVRHRAVNFTPSAPLRVFPLPRSFRGARAQCRGLARAASCRVCFSSRLDLLLRSTCLSSFLNDPSIPRISNALPSC